MHAGLTVLTAALMSASAAAQDLAPAAPGSVGMTDAGIAKLKAEMKRLVDEGTRTGVVFAVAREGKLVAEGAYGHRNVERNLPMTMDTQFRLASLSRVLTGATVLTLLDEGQIALTDPVSKFIPEFAATPVIKSAVGDAITTEPQRTPLTVRHLFTYTGGFGYGTDWPKTLGMRQDLVLGPDQTLADGIRKLASYPLLTQPGDKWRYGFSGDVLGRVAEVASGQPLDEFLRTHMFDKIGMKDTGFWTKDAARLAEIYGPGPDGKTVNLSSRASNLSTFTTPPKMMSAGGGLVSTVPDYLRFAQMLMNQGRLDGVQVLKAETARAMLSRQTTPAQGLVYWYDPGKYVAFNGYAWGYAIGVRVDEGQHGVPGTIGDAGWAGFTNTWFFIDPKEKIAAVAMTQYLGPDDEAVVIKRLRTGVYEALVK